MKSPAAWFRKLGLLVHRDTFHRELDDELAFHREQLEREFEADGLTAEDAHYAAQRRIGNEALLKERSQQFSAR